jgi:Zn-dependent peptidase ImmA (M78 family)
MSMRVPVSPAILAWACERAGHDVDAYAARFPNLPAWIRGESQPTLKQLESFAKATHAPLGYLFLATPPEENVPIPDFRTMPGERRRPSPELLETIYVCQERQDWYRDFARTSGERALPFVGSAAPGDDIVRVASEIRSTLGFDLEARREASSWSEALRQFIGQADAAGIMVMCSGVVMNNNNRPLDPTEFRGFAIVDALAPLVFVNGADTKAAQMFTLAHELGHVWLGQSAVSDAEAGRVAQHHVEQWCNLVAAELLVPLSLMEREYSPKAALRDELDRLARRFKVSTLVVLRRIHDLGALSRTDLWDEYQREQARLTAITRGGGGNFYLTQAARVSKRFARALVVSTLEGQTLYRDAYRMLGVSKQSTFEALGHSLGVL